jgi:hypothetical protein
MQKSFNDHSSLPRTFTKIKEDTIMQIILNSEQEKLLQEELNSGKYKTPEQVITDALKLLAEKRSSPQPKPRVTISSKEATQKLLEEKLLLMRELNKNVTPDPQRQALAEEFHKLCEETQLLHAASPLTAEEIAEEIEAYRSGE